MQFPLSILDLSPVDAGVSSGQALRNTIAAARVADRLGFTRYWLAEHHNTTMLASSTPEVMIGYVAEATKHIRVGSGGIMLPNHAALKVAETFRLLAALHPDRIDLGIGRAPGTDGRTALALRGSRGSHGADDFPEQLAELFAFSGERDGFPAGHPFRAVKATPDDVQLPPVWLLGSSDYSAQAAAELGVGFAFAHHINPGFALPAIELYRSRFKPSERLQAPKVILTTSVVCAETAERADELATGVGLTWLKLRSGRPEALQPPEVAQSYPYTAIEQEVIRDYRSRQIIGSPAVVRDKLLELQKTVGADELMITTLVHGYANRIKAYELLAEAFELQQPAITAEDAIASM